MYEMMIGNVVCSIVSFLVELGEVIQYFSYRIPTILFGESPGNISQSDELA